MMLIGLLITLPLAALSGVPARLGPGSGAWLAVSGVGNVGGLVLTYRALRVGQVSLVAPSVRWWRACFRHRVADGPAVVQGAHQGHHQVGHP